MFVWDFYVIMYAHWAEEPEATPGCTAIGDICPVSPPCRDDDPGRRGVVESSSGKSTNKALVWAVKVNLVHIKDSGGKGRRCVHYDGQLYLPTDVLP
jgi:hypothetical protein